MQIFGFCPPSLPEIVIFFARGNSLSQNLTVWMESFCLPSACKDAPLGQRQGGVFRVPPPYLWTPPTPQRAKGYTPLTILKKKSKHKKASAAPVGAIALTLFSLLHLKPLSRCATAPPGERTRPQTLRLSRKLYRHAKGSLPEGAGFAQQRLREFLFAPHFSRKNSQITFQT